MRKAIFLSKCCAIAFLTALGFGQASPAGWKGTIAVENGVKTIKNPAAPLYGEFAFDLQEELSIGGDPTKENYYFPGSALLSVDRDGRFYVADLRNRRVMMYAPSGEFIRQIGRQGQGPGEYAYPGRVFIDSEGNAMVYSGRELVCFGKDGTFIKKISIKIFLSQAVLGPGGTLIGRTQPGRGPEGPKHQLVQVGADGEHFKTIVEFRGEFRASQTAIIVHAYSNFLSFTGLSPDSFVYGFPDDYRLVIADAEGKTILAMTKNEKPKSISNRERAETKKSGIYALIGTNDKMLRDEDFPDHRPFFGWIFSDDAGHIYVARTRSILEQDAPWEIDVFSKDGFYLYHMSWPAFPSAIQSGCWYEVRTDKDSGEVFIVRSRIKNWTSMKTR
jgi:hypothetical protein